MNPKILVLVVVAAVSLFMGSAAAVTPQNQHVLDSDLGDYNYQSDGFNNQFFELYETNNTLKVNISTNTDPGNYTENIQLVNASNNNQTITRSYSIIVDGFTNWTIQPKKLEQDISVGDTGELQKLYLNSTGNENKVLNLSIKDSAANFLDVRPTITAIPGTNRSILIAYTTSRDTQKGVKNATLQVNGRDAVNVSLSLQDDIDPVIESLSVGDLMATTEEEFSAVVKDNLQVEKAEADIWKKVEVPGNNKTIITNQTVVSNAQFKAQGGGATYTYKFTDSNHITQYWLNLSVNDTSGNTVSQLETFQVNGLDSINVLETDFRFKDSRPRTDEHPQRKITHTILKKDLDKKLGVKLSSFTHRKTNSSMTVGIRNTGSESVEKLYTDGEKQGRINISGSGSYELVVYSDAKGDSYDGTLTLYPPQQHVDINREIDFRGAIVDPDYPELPPERRIGEFVGEMEFILNDNDVPVGIRFEGETREISDCKGAESWSNCLPGYTLGEIPEVRKKYRNFKDQRNFAVVGAALVVFFSIARLAAVTKPYTAYLALPPKREDFKEHWTEEEFEEIKSSWVKSWLYGR